MLYVIYTRYLDISTSVNYDYVKHNLFTLIYERHTHPPRLPRAIV